MCLIRTGGGFYGACVCSYGSVFASERKKQSFVFTKKAGVWQVLDCRKIITNF